jgi:hypothetical protein
MNATFAPVEPVRGPVAPSQSGGLGIELMSRAGELGIGISEFVSVGNKSDVSGNDCCSTGERSEHGRDPLLPRVLGTRQVRPARVGRGARPSSRSRADARRVRAASSHTAALATPDVAVDALSDRRASSVSTRSSTVRHRGVLAHQPSCRAARRDRRERRRPGHPRRRRVRRRSRRPRALRCDPDRAARLSRTASVGNPSTSSCPRPRSSTSARGSRARRPCVDVLVLFVPPLVTNANDVARTQRRSPADSKPVVAQLLGRGVPDAPATQRTGPFRRSRSRSGRARTGRAADLADWRARPEPSPPTRISTWKAPDGSSTKCCARGPATTRDRLLARGA